MKPTTDPRDAVTEPRDDPIVAQRRLRSALRRLRLRPDTKETQKQVAAALDWSPAKVLRIESGQVPIATSDLIALLTHYGVTDRSEIDEHIELARISRQTTLRDTYQDVSTKAFAEFVQHEAYASVIRQFETKLVPGVLQTEDYATAIIHTYLNDADARVVNRLVQARLERSRYLFNRSDGGPEMIFILDEAVLQRHVGKESGNTALMVEQLEQLKKMNARPNIKILVVPFDLGIYTALRGPFEILEFEDPADSSLLYLENPHGDELIHEDTDEIGPYLDMFFDLENTLTKRTETVQFDDRVDEIIQRIRAASR